MPLQQMVVRLDADQVEWLREKSRESGAPQSEILRRALRLAMVDWAALTPELLDGVRRLLDATER